MSSRESASNFGFVCKEHAPKPGKYQGQEPSLFVGKLVKLGFPAKRSNGHETIEHMWVKVEKLQDDQLVGTLENDPFLECEYQYGDGVLFQVEEIEDVQT